MPNSLLERPCEMTSQNCLPPTREYARSVSRTKPRGGSNSVARRRLCDRVPHFDGILKVNFALSHTPTHIIAAAN